MLFLCGGGKISAGYRNHGKVRVKHMTQIDKNIAFNLKRIRKSKNMSLDMLAERTGVSKSMLGQIERGESNPTVSTIGKIVEGLKVPFEQLIYNRKEIMVVPSPEEAPVQGKGRGIPDLCDAALRCRKKFRDLSGRADQKCPDGKRIPRGADLGIPDGGIRGGRTDSGRFQFSGEDRWFSLFCL